MEVVVNGQAHSTGANSTVSQLLATLQLNVRAVAVEVNGELVPRMQHQQHQLEPGDRIEIVTLVGGG